MFFSCCVPHLLWEAEQFTFSRLNLLFYASAGILTFAFTLHTAGTCSGSRRIASLPVLRVSGARRLFHYPHWTGGSCYARTTFACPVPMDGSTTLLATYYTYSPFGVKTWVTTFACTLQFLFPLLPVQF